MKRFIAAALVGILVIMVAGCKSAEEKANEEALKQTNDLINSMIAENQQSVGSSDANPQKAEPKREEPAEPKPEAINLNLPISVKETTFLYGDNNNSIRITPDGALQKQITIDLRELNDAEQAEALVESGKLKTGYSVDDFHAAMDDLLSEWYWYNFAKWEDIDTDVRSFMVAMDRSTFYIKNDNSLWAFGSNASGRLGDGTGMDKETPVQILDNVAEVYADSAAIYALKADKSLWRWGDGKDYSPVQTMNDVVKKMNHLYQFSDGSIGESKDKPISSEPVYDGVGDGYSRLEYYINSEHKLIHSVRNSSSGQYENQEIADNVDRFFWDLSGRNYFYIKSDGSLWGFGENKKGELGDSTKAPRNEPVKLADDIAGLYYYAYLKTDGTFWVWDEGNPVPRLLYNNVVDYLNNCVYFVDGSLVVVTSRWTNVEEKPEEYCVEFDNVKTPQTVVFD